MNRWYYTKKWFSIFPGFLRPVSAPFLHDYYRQRQAERSWPRLIVDGMVCIGFKTWVPIRARWVAHRLGLDRRWMRKATRIARRRFVDPNEIAVFRMDSDSDAERYVRRFEYAAISKRINPPAWRRDCVLADKALFESRCVHHGVPTPPLLARIIDGKARIFDVPATDEVALKPNRGLGGAGFALLRRPADTWNRANFEQLLVARSAPQRGDWIVQPKVEGHAGLRDLALNALSTARITTMRNERREIEIITTVLRFAGTCEAIVDNLASGGLLAPIDEATGRLGRACYGRRLGDFSIHPVTGAQIEGRILPCWGEARALVLDAHRHAFPEYSMVGWDVGIAAEGPLLIEGNGKPGLFAAQRAERTGVGETRFGDLVAYHLAKIAT